MHKMSVYEAKYNSHLMLGRGGGYKNVQTMFDREPLTNITGKDTCIKDCTTIKVV